MRLGVSGQLRVAPQTIVLRRLQAHLLQKQEDWVGAATALKQIPLEGTSRLIPDEEKLAIYMQIVRLLLEVSTGRASSLSELQTLTQDLI